MSRSTAFLGVAAFALAMLRCSWHVPHERVYGTYVASYPYGTETITLKSDGTFVQEVVIGKEQPVTVQGVWEFDSRRSTHVVLRGAMAVDDGVGHLRSDWRKAGSFIVNHSVGIEWFKVVMGSGGEYPLIKQRDETRDTMPSTETELPKPARAPV